MEDEKAKKYMYTIYLLHIHICFISFPSLLILPHFLNMHTLSPKRMFPFSSWWRTGLLLLLFLAVAVRESWQTEEKTCDLIGEKGKESEKELALLTRLKPLFNKR